jgi:hypothetical protein
MHIRRVRSLTEVAVVAAAIGIACNRAPKAPPPAQKPDGPSEFKAWQQAFQNVRQATLERTTTTDLGVFKETMEVDCASRYFHSRYTKDLTPKGIESNTTQLQGRPRAHQEEERLFAEGQSFNRFTGSWENPAAGTDDAHPDWGTARNSYDPTAECESFQQSKVPFVPFDKILATNKIEYKGERTLNGAQCHEFKVAYPDLVDSDQMKKVDAGGGSSTSYREQVTKVIESTICLGVPDLLPRQATKGDVTFTYSYESFDKLGIPAVSPPRF